LREHENKMNMNELEIINRALDNLKKTTGIQAVWTDGEQYGGDGGLDLFIDNREHKYLIEAKKEFRPFHLPAIYKMAEKGIQVMVIAEKIFPKVKEALRQHKIAYLEANGNLFVCDGGAYIWTDTNKPVSGEKIKEDRAFAKGGLKLIFQILLDKEWLEKPYRQIAETFGMGIGNITNIFRGLKQEGFLLATGKNKYRLVNKKELLQKWMIAYDKKLKPAIKIGAYRFLVEADFKEWKKLPLQKEKTCWGGEPAGDLLTGYLKPKILTLYTNETQTELIKNYRLVPDQLGQLQIFQKFWLDTEKKGEVIPPLLVYADLIATGDQRCLETAQKIYDELLADQF
jgi:hypothetical protein